MCRPVRHILHFTLMEEISCIKSERESFMTTDTEGNVIHIFGRELTPINIRRNNTAKILHSHELVAAVRCDVQTDADGPGLGLG